VTFEEFSSGSSFIHRLDPRAKIIPAVLFSAVVASADRFEVLALSLLTAAVLTGLARLSLTKVINRLLLVNTFILLLWFILPFSFPATGADPPVFILGPLSASREGVLLALGITVKSNAIVLMLIALLATSNIFNLVHALVHLKAPEKLVQLLFFTFRYFHVMHQEYLKLRAAMRVRGFQAGTNMHTYKSLAYLAGMLLIRSLDRSERVHQAMLCRGFDGRFWVLDHFRFKPRDWVFLAVMTGLILWLGLGQWSSLWL